MLNYLKMDGKRLLRTRGFYAAMLLALFFLGMFALAGYFVTGFAEEFMPASESLMNDQMRTAARRYMSFNLFFSFFFSLPGMRMLHALLSLFAAGYLAREHQSGYLKNLFCLRSMRARWLISKLFTLLAASALYYLVFGLGCALVQLLYGNPLQVDLAELLPFLGGQMLADMALFSVIMLSVVLLQSKAAAVLTAMALSLNVQGLVYLLIDWVDLLPVKLSSWGMMNLAAQAQLPGGIMSIISGAGGGQAFGLSGDPAMLVPVAGTVFALFTALSALCLYRVDYRG